MQNGCLPDSCVVLTLDELEGLFAMIDERSEILVGTRGVIPNAEEVNYVVGTGDVCIVDPWEVVIAGIIPINNYCCINFFLVICLRIMMQDYVMSEFL